MLRSLIIGAAVLMVTACGGGTWSGCAGESQLSLSVQWNSNGQMSSQVNGQVGVPLTATPVISGIPAACQGSKAFSLGMPLPGGLELDSRSGVISGTPTRAISFTQDGIVILSLAGFQKASILNVVSIAPAP